MKIFIIGSESPDNPGTSLKTVLLRRGHNVIVFDLNKHLMGTFKIPRRIFNIPIASLTEYGLRGILGDSFQLANRAAINAIARFMPDLVLTTDITMIAPETVSEVKTRTGAIFVGWFMDAIVNFGRGYFFAAEYDALFFKDKFIVSKLRQTLSANNIFYLPQCCDPELHRPIEIHSSELLKYQCDLTIAGNLYCYRARMLEQFDSYDLKIWGLKQRHVNHKLNQKHTSLAVFGLEKSKAMRAAKIVLNNNHYGEIAGINKRTFEVAGAGAFQLTDGPAVADYFKPGIEIATFDSKNDLKEKVDYFLAKPEERRKIAEAGRIRAHRDHTYEKRWDEIVRVLSIISTDKKLHKIEP